jgi:hypothetical protein
MNKTIITTVLLTFLSSLAMTAQVPTKDQYETTLFIEHIERIGSNNFDYLDEEFTGSPYGNPIFLLGKIYENNKVVASNYALRYNAMADEIEVKKTLYVEDSEIKALTKSPELYVKIMNDMYVYSDSNEIIGNAGYFLVLYVGDNYNLYKKIYKKYYPAKKAQNSFEKDVLAKFADRSIYYLVTQEGVFQEFPSSKSKKLKLFGNKQAEIKKFAKKAKLDISDEDDLLKIVKYYDSLSSSDQ